MKKNLTFILALIALFILSISVFADVALPDNFPNGNYPHKVSPKPVYHDPSIVVYVIIGVVAVAILSLITLSISTKNHENTPEVAPAFGAAPASKVEPLINDETTIQENKEE